MCIRLHNALNHFNHRRRLKNIFINANAIIYHIDHINTETVPAEKRKRLFTDPGGIYFLSSSDLFL